MDDDECRTGNRGSLLMPNPEETRLQVMSDAQLQAYRQTIDDELRTRAFERIEAARWDVGVLRGDLGELPADLPMLVNVNVEFLGTDEQGYLPLVVTGGGFEVTGADEIPSTYSIETQPPERVEGRLVWIPSQRLLEGTGWPEGSTLAPSLVYPSDGGSVPVQSQL